MNNKKVWFVSHYSMPPEYEMRIKTQMYAHYLGLQGIECVIFSASTIHNSDINLITDHSPYLEKQYDDLKFVHIKCDQYEGNGASRIKNLLQFAYRFSKYANRFDLPDVVVADVNCVNYKPIFKWCKKNRIPMFIDMRDLWPASIVEFLHYSNNNPLIRYLYHRERKMYRDVEGVIFSMEGGKDYIKDKGWKELDFNKFYYINNGVDLRQFNTDYKENKVVDSDLSNDLTFKVVYTGSIRTANNVFAIVEAAELMKDTNVMFLIYGDGDQRITLENYCREHEISNVVFKGQVPKNHVPSILSQCDLTILNYKKTMIGNYGGSQNKLFEYLAAGKPVLSTIKMNYSILDKFNCGITINEPDPKKIASAVSQVMNLSAEELSILSNNALEASKLFDYEVLSNQLRSIIRI